MLLHIFGKENRKTIVMIHGLGMSWDMLYNAIDILEQFYQVIAVAVLQHMTLRTIWCAYDSTDNYSMPECVDRPGTDIWYWYGEREKKERRLDLRYVRRHIKNTHFRRLPQMAHGQYVIARPELFAKDICKICEKTKNKT